MHIDVADIGIVTVRAEGEIDLHHGNDVYLTADPAKLHRFNENGQAVQ